MGSGSPLGSGEALALAEALALGAAEGLGITAVSEPATNVPVPPSAVVSVSSPLTTAQVVTLPSSWAKIVPYDPSGQATSVLAPSEIVMPSSPFSAYVPDTALQSALAARDPSVANATVYSDCSSGGKTPWNAGVWPVIAVSCQVLPVRAPLSGPRPRNRKMAMAPMATAAMIPTVTSWERCCMSLSLRAGHQGLESGGAPAMVPDRLACSCQTTIRTRSGSVDS